MTTTKYYYKEVEICGEKIKAEYFTFGSNPSTNQNKALRLWDKITDSYYRIKRNLTDIYWEIRYGFQRMFRGYDSVDIFDTFSKFTDRYYKILTRYKNIKNSHPGTMSEEEWDNIINDMLLHLYYMNEYNVDKELCKNVPDNWIPRHSTVQPIMDKHKDEFFKLFSKYFYYLWD